jgi:dihydrofolate reductase
MIKTTLFILVSQDGFIADNQGSVDQLISEKQKEDYGFSLFYKAITGILMGRKTYEQITTYGVWPYGAKKTYVFTKQTLLKPNKNVTFVTDNISHFMQTLDQVNIKDEYWLVGGAQLITAFYTQGLINRYILTIIPKTLGSGILLPKPIWREESMQKYDTQYYFDGVVQHYYEQESH